MNKAHRQDTVEKPYEPVPKELNENKQDNNSLDSAGPLPRLFQDTFILS